MTSFDVNIELYKIFYVVAKLLNISKAAQELYISQPAVTMNIKKLEDTLGTILFIRNKRGVTLTNEGKVLYEHVKMAMESLKAGENKLEGLKTLENGTIRIGCGVNLAKYFLVNHLEKFHKNYPKISIDIDTSTTSNLLKKLNDGKLDMAVISNDSSSFNEFDIAYSKDISYVFACNSNYADLVTKKVTLDELNNYPLLLQPQISNARRILDNVAKQRNVILTSSMELSSYSLAIEFAKIGLGISFVAEEFIQKELEEKQLYKINVWPTMPNQKVLVLIKKKYLPSFSTQKFIEIIKSNEYRNSDNQ